MQAEMRTPLPERGERNADNKRHWFYAVSPGSKQGWWTDSGCSMTRFWLAAVARRAPFRFRWLPHLGMAGRMVGKAWVRALHEALVGSCCHCMHIHSRATAGNQPSHQAPPHPSRQHVNLMWLHQGRSYPSRCGQNRKQRKRPSDGLKQQTR